MTLTLPKPTRATRLSRDRKRLDYTSAPLPKSASVANPKFRAFARRWCELKQRVKGHFCSPMIAGTDYQHRRPLIDFCHIPTGGKRAMSRKASDVGGGFGMCADFHDEQHRIGWPRFAKKYGIDPKLIAAEIAAEWERKGRR